MITTHAAQSKAENLSPEPTEESHLAGYEPFDAFIDAVFDLCIRLEREQKVENDVTNQGEVLE